MQDLGLVVERTFLHFCLPKDISEAEFVVHSAGQGALSLASPADVMSTDASIQDAQISWLIRVYIPNIATTI